jgi:hypothetical protein
VTRFSFGGVVALALAACLPACSGGGHHQPKTAAASLVPPDALAYVDFTLKPPTGERAALDQLLGGLGRPAGIDVVKDVSPWAKDDVALAVLRDRRAVVITGVDDDKRAEVALNGAKLAHRRVLDREVIAKDAATLDALVAPGSQSLAGTDRFRRLEAAALPAASRLGLGLIDTVVCRAGSKGRVDFSVRAAGKEVVVEGTAGGSLADMAPGQPSATDGLPVDTLALLMAFDGHAMNDVADTALGCLPTLSPTPTLTSVLSAGLPPGFPRNFGINIDRDVMPWLRGETVVAVGPPRNPGAVADIGVVARPVDSAQASGALPRLEDGLAGAGQFQWVGRDQGGAHFLTVPQPIAGVPGLQPSVGLVNGRVVVASSPDYFVALARPRQPTLGSSAAYQVEVSRPAGATLARAVLHLGELRTLFGGRLPLLTMSPDAFVAKADTVVLTLTREATLTRIRLAVRLP